MAAQINPPRVGVAVLIQRKGKLLLHRRKGMHGKGTWSVAGGHLEYGETPEDCAIREVWEEMGIRIGEVSFVGITNDVFTDTGLHYITIWMRAALIEGDPVVAAPEEVEEIGWFSLGGLPQPLFLPLEHFFSGQLYSSSEIGSTT
ncbi:MAG: NUDIX domain-containing protein [Anaerolineae bacterium]|nr:NUDIX domain-containing protein [Anaerolineae bacterium]